MYNQIDLCLDPFPCNGYITSLDALWMGVPIITLIGKTIVGRAGWSLLSNLKLAELAAQTPEEYISKAAQLAGDSAQAPGFARHVTRSSAGVISHGWKALCRQYGTRISANVAQVVSKKTSDKTVSIQGFESITSAKPSKAPPWVQ